MAIGLTSKDADALAGSSTSNFLSRKRFTPLHICIITPSDIDIFHSGDMFAQDSIELLQSSGIDFEKFENYGIDVQYFGELLMMSGLVLNDEIKWVSFHSSYDFGYLLKTLTCTDLPMDEPAFMELLLTYFPSIYDVKVAATSVQIDI
jgi:hypothetical protein